VTDPKINFDPVAPAYRWLEYMSFGPWLVRCRAAQIPQLANARHALVLGDGDGRFLERLLAANPSLIADVVDSSASMLRLLERRLSKSGALRRVRLHHADALGWKPTASYDLIVSHFFLDCFFPWQLERLFDRVLPHAVAGAQWVVSEFAIPRSRIARAPGRSLIYLLYLAFGRLTGLPVRALPDYASLLGRRGLILTRESSYLSGLLCSQLWTIRNLQTEDRTGIVEAARMCQSSAMDRDRVLVILRQHAPELKAAGLTHLHLFGSVARNQTNEESDVDLMAEFDRSKPITLMTVGRLESQLGDLLGMKVDLSSAEWMKEPVRRRVLQEAIVAF
jgi:predicted nucleotidyltransferase